MYYHVAITTNNQHSKNEKPYIKVDLQNLEEDIIKKIVVPYCTEDNNKFEFIGHRISPAEIHRVVINQSTVKSDEIIQQINKERDFKRNIGGAIFGRASTLSIINSPYVTDITDEIMSKVRENNDNIPIKNQNIEINKTPPPKYFISHSVKDGEYAEAVVDMLESMGISDEIFCSSLSGYTINIGEKWDERLKKELNSQTFVIFLISENFYKSKISLCEMGAAWALSKAHALVLIPPMEFSQLEGIITNTQGFFINESEKWTTLKDQLDLSTKNNTKWETKKNRIINNINKIINSQV